jgi:hypothetical protein
MWRWLREDGLGRGTVAASSAAQGLHFQLFLDDPTPFFNVVPKSSRNTDSTAKSILN